MTTQDGIGAPRRSEVINRDKKVMKLIRQRAAEGLCTRHADVRKVLGKDLSRSQVFYTLKRLEAAGEIERRAGYLWCLAREASDPAS